MVCHIGVVAVTVVIGIQILDTMGKGSGQGIKRSAGIKTRVVYSMAFGESRVVMAKSGGDKRGSQ